MDFITSKAECKKTYSYINTDVKNEDSDFKYSDNEKSVLQNTVSYEQLKKYLHEIDLLFPTALSSKVDLDIYAEKLLTKSVLCTKIIDNKIVSLVSGYANDFNNKLAYIAIVGTLPVGTRKGYAENLIREFIKKSEERGMTAVHLYTEKSNASARELYKKLGFEDYHIDNEPRPDDCHLIYWIRRKQV